MAAPSGTFAVGGALTLSDTRRLAQLPAAATLALALGLLLSGGAVGQTDSASSVPADGVLPGVALVTEEVEPGVFLVASDGIRDLSRPTDRSDLYLDGIFSGSIVAGDDGSVWLFWPDSFFRLGDPETHAWKLPKERSSRPSGLVNDYLQVGPDGKAWFANGKTARRFTGKRWKEVKPSTATYEVEVLPDGSYWLLRRRADDTAMVIVSHKRERTRLPAFFYAHAIEVSDDGTPWLARRSPPRGIAIYRYEGDAWEEVDAPAAVAAISVGPDGTLWASLEGDDGWPSTRYGRFDGDEWTEYDESDGVPLSGGAFQAYAAFHQVGPDGSLWLTPRGDFDVTGHDCDGIGRFDGETLDRYLPGTCIYAMDIAPDGSVWLQAGEYEFPEMPTPERPSTEGLRPGGPLSDVRTYVIRPAGTEGDPAPAD
jgi:hypothetical protein